MKLNRKWVLVLSMVLSLAMAASGTLAYLSDTDSQTNTFTLGGVDIELEEVFGNGEEDDKPVLAPGAKIKKEATIKNIGDIPAYVWLTIDMPEGLENIVELEWASAVEMLGAPVTAGGRTTYTALYPTPLAEKTGTTGKMLLSVTMKNDAKIDFDTAGYLTYEDSSGQKHQVALEGDKTTGYTLDMDVYAYGIQAAGFNNVRAAYKAYGGEDPKPGENTKPADPRVEYNGTTYDDIYKAVAAANANGGGTLKLLGPTTLNAPVEISSNITIDGDGQELTRAVGFTGTMFTVASGSTLTVDDLSLNGAGATATGNLIATAGNGSIVLNNAILQNNHGAHAVSLATRGGGSLTLNNGAEIINNSSDSGAIWGGGQITVNEGSKINGNSSTGLAGAIRMVGSCNLTMNGGEICNNTAATDGGAIWGYGSSTYNFNGGKMSGNTAGGTGGAMYTGTYSVINISGDFEMCNNTAVNSGAIRLTDHTSLTMTGGKVSGNKSTDEPFNTWNNTMSLTGGVIDDDINYVGGLGLTIGECDINGVIHYNLATNHNTAYLAKDFEGFKFTVDQSASNFSAFNFKPASGYTYTAGDEAKLQCQNEGYSTYWDAATGTFRLKAN